jgi:hypothetical protein
MAVSYGQDLYPHHRLMAWMCLELWTYAVCFVSDHSSAQFCSDNNLTYLWIHVAHGILMKIVIRLRVWNLVWQYIIMAAARQVEWAESCDCKPLHYWCFGLQSGYYRGWFLNFYFSGAMFTKIGILGNITFVQCKHMQEKKSIMCTSVYWFSGGSTFLTLHQAGQ